VNASDDLSDTIFVIVDGFLMFWDEEINSMFEMRIFVREAKETLQRRRQERKGYVSEGCSGKTCSSLGLCV